MEIQQGTPRQPHRPSNARPRKPTRWHMCVCRWGTRVHLHEHEVRYLDGTSEHPVNQGVI
jgi:hypothetical protein